MIIKKTSTFGVLKNVYLKRSEPLSVVHFLTNRCNARCSFCFIDFDHPNTFKGELSLEEIDKLTKNLGKSLLNVNLTGGEPFARKDIVDIAKIYLKNTVIQSMYITTNAGLPDRIENFAKIIFYFDFISILILFLLYYYSVLFERVFLRQLFSLSRQVVHFRRELSRSPPQRTHLLILIRR